MISCCATSLRPRTGANGQGRSGNRRGHLVRLLLLWTLLPLGLSAQTILPVQSSLQLLPPYSVYLSDYAQPGAQKLRVILLQRDLSQSAYSLRLVFWVELNGRVILRTARAFNPPPLLLDPGVPTVIAGADLAPYLDSRNLEFVGYSREQYERTRALPEGSYRLCVSAYDYRRQDVPVAAQACAFYFLAKSEPPLINYPACGTKLPAKPVQQVVFSWLPRNTASANSAATTEYEFSLYEVRPAGRNVNDVVLASKPIYQVSTDYTQLVYGVNEPGLQEGMQYVWRVQAKDKDGKDSFRNNGYSEVCSFTYGGVDPAFVVGGVREFKASAQAERKATLSWQVDQKGFQGYRVEYKKTGVGYEWFKTDTKEGELKVFDLEADTEYEARVQGQVKGVYGPYTEVITFRTPKTRVIACGENASVAQLQQGKPLAFATPGMSIQARGMEVILEEVEPLPEDGFYKGSGRVSINYLGGAAFAVRFERIYIDEDRNVVSGRIDVLSNSNQMTDVVAWAQEAFKPLTEKLDDLLTKLTEPQLNKEQIPAAIDDYVEYVQTFISQNKNLPDSVQQQLREDALLLETSKAGFLAANDESSSNTIVATIQQQAQQAKDRIDALQGQQARNSNQFDNTPIVVNGRSYDLQTIEGILNELKLKSKVSYNSLDRKHKLILDLPLILWKIGWKYSSICMLNWIQGTGESLNFPFEWFMSYPRTQKAYNAAYSSLQQSLNGYASINDSQVFAFGYLYNFNECDACKTSYNKASAFVNNLPLDKEDAFGDYNLTTHISEEPKSINLIRSVSIGSGLGDLDDLGGSLGRFSLRQYVVGKVLKRKAYDIFGNEDGFQAELTIEEVGIRFADTFSFEDAVTEVASQFLGGWKHDLTNPALPTKNTFAQGYINLYDDTFVEFSKITGLGKSYLIYSDTHAWRDNNPAKKVIKFVLK